MLWLRVFAHRERQDRSIVNTRIGTEQARECAIGTSEGEHVDETRRTAVDDAIATATRLLAEGAREVGLAHARGAGDDKLAQEGLVQATLGSLVEVLKTGLRLGQLGLAQASGEGAPNPVTGSRGIALDALSQQRRVTQLFKQEGSLLCFIMPPAVWPRSSGLSWRRVFLWSESFLVSVLLVFFMIISPCDA
jgi:hypothetical protein